MGQFSAPFKKRQLVPRFGLPPLPRPAAFGSSQSHAPKQRGKGGGASAHYEVTKATRRFFPGPTHLTSPHLPSPGRQRASTGSPRRPEKPASRPEASAATQNGETQPKQGEGPPSLPACLPTSQGCCGDKMAADERREHERRLLSCALRCGWNEMVIFTTDGVGARGGHRPPRRREKMAEGGSRRWRATPPSSSEGGREGGKVSVASSQAGSFLSVLPSLGPGRYLHPCPLQQIYTR